MRHENPKNYEIPVISVQLQPRIATSHLDDFVLEHGPADILRELVQNEFDGRGSHIGIHFGQKELKVTGTGKRVDAKGWSRLSVITGTGMAIGGSGDNVIHAKVNGIGSKNHGLRALFYFGDTIFVRSDGHSAILDARHLAVGRQDDPESSGDIGVLIQVPYRTAPLRTLPPPFTVERETRTLDAISEFFPTLLKLGFVGERSGIEGLTVSSERTGREFRWQQSARKLKSRTRGVIVTQRNGLLHFTDADGRRRSQKHRELEFSRLVEIPEVHTDEPIPGYYRLGRRVRIAVSVPVRGERVIERAGSIYYPLQAGRAHTGTGVSVSAPFSMNGDRTRPFDSDFNNWLMTEAANLAVELVATDWFNRFGVSAYAALCLVGNEEPGSFQAMVTERMKTSACWPSQVKGQIVKAAGLHRPKYPDFEYSFLERFFLDRRLAADARVTAMAYECGVKCFAINSIVRLRCAYESREQLATPLNPKKETDIFWSAKSDLLQNEYLQIATAKALTAHYKQLSTQNRQDLRDTPTTLAADGQLRPACELVVVPEELWDGCPEPLATRLHPNLRGLKAVSVHCV
jgi:hypothetical protein